MGKSPGGNVTPPETWTPPANMINQNGRSAMPGPDQGLTPNFLPNDPTQMANGLTPEMVALILGTSPQVLNGQTGRDDLASTIAGSGGQV